MNSMQTDNDLDVSIVFRSPALPGLSILWKMQSARLSLVSSGGGTPAAVVAKKHSAAYRTLEGAEAGAARWFVVLASIYGAVETAAEAGNVTKKVAMSL